MEYRVNISCVMKALMVPRALKKKRIERECPSFCEIKFHITEKQSYFLIPFPQRDSNQQGFISSRVPNVPKVLPYASSQGSTAFQPPTATSSGYGKMKSEWAPFFSAL